MPRNDAWEDIYEGVRFNHADEPLVVAIESARQQLRSERDGYRGALVGLLSLLGTGETYRIIRKHINQALKAGDATPPATREGVWNPNGEGEQPDIPGGNAKDHARAKQPVIAYACLYPKLAAVAREHGYALAMHGSLVADCDLIAVPWVENAAPGDDLARALAAAAPGHLILDTYTARPGGVRKHVIHLGGGPYIDLAVCEGASR